MKNFVEIDTSFTDDNGVTFIDGYTTYAMNEDGVEGEPGEVIGYIFNKGVYYTNPEYSVNHQVQEFINELRKEGEIL